MLLSEFGPFKLKTRVVVKEDRESVASAIANRILRMHPDRVGQYGVDKVIAAIDDVAEFVGDVDEIGTSDVSGWVKQVFDQLDRQQGVAEGFMSEVDIELHNIAKSEDEEELIDAMEGLKGTGVQIALEDMMSDLADELAAKGMNDIINDQDRMIELLMDKVVAEYSEGDIETNESLRPGEYHVATVTFDDGSKKKVKITTDEGFRGQIINHFTRKGLTVKDIDVDWSIQSGELKEFKDEEETGDLRTGWLIKKAKRQFPMASSDAEAVAMWMNDKEEKDVDRLDRVNDIEDAMIDRLSDVDSKVQNKLNDVEHRLRALEKSQSNESLRATAQEVSKYLAEMKESGYDI